MLVQYSPWVSIIAVGVISYSSLSLGVGRFFFWGGGYMDLAQIHISIELLLHYSATCFKSCLYCAGESRSARKAGISVIFQWIVAGWGPEWECDCRKNISLHTTHTLQETRFLKYTIGLLSPNEANVICDRSSGILTAYSNYRCQVLKTSLSRIIVVIHIWYKCYSSGNKKVYSACVLCTWIGLQPHSNTEHLTSADTRRGRRYK